MSYDKLELPKTIDRSSLRDEIIHVNGLEKMFPNIAKKRRKEIKINLSITPMDLKKNEMEENERYK
jgi:hypothetical protein